jgi:hypothetical protein
MRSWRVSFAAVIFLRVPVVYTKKLQNAGSDKIPQAGKTSRGGVDQLKMIAEKSNATNGSYLTLPAVEATAKAQRLMQ